MTDAPATPPKRMTLSQVLELLLTRSPRDHSSITLSRNAKGETQIEVVVRTTENEDIPTVVAAEREAIAIYDRLRERYPLAADAVRDAEAAARREGAAIGRASERKRTAANPETTA